MAREITRRDVLRGTAAVAAGLVAVPSFAEAQRAKRLRVGIIGAGGKGWSGMEWAAEYGDIVAVCDVNVDARIKAMTQHPSADSFEDFRVMLDTMKGRLDAVVISTPDHTHAVAAAMAMKQGLHTYCEKPLCRTIWEVRQLQRIAREKRVATQMGNQSTASTPMRKTAELIRRGTFGKVKEVHLWTDRAGGWWKQGVGRPAPAVPPKTLDWNLWLGPRPDAPYGEGIQPFSWRGFWDYGTGALGDMGCHIFNMPFMALDLRDPLTVQAETSGHNKVTFPEWSIVHYEFGERNRRAPLTLHWYDGGKRPSPSLAPGVTYGGNGVIVVCENATIYSPDESNTQFMIIGGAPMPDVQIDESPGHMAEFFRAAQGGPAAKSNLPDYACPLTETVLLGNLAIWANGPKLDWDARRMAVRGTSEFDSLIRPTFRRGWSV